MSRPKVHEKRDSDEETARASREGPEGRLMPVVAVTVAREREKKDKKKHSALIG